MSHSTAINQTAPITSEQGKPQSTSKYGLATVDDLHVRRAKRSSGGRVTLRELEIEGQPVKTMKRFWRSFVTRFGIAENIFGYFTPGEVFNRISEVNQNVSFRYCVAKRVDAKGAADHQRTVRPFQH